MNNNIEPDKYYSAKQVVDMKVLPWKSAMTFNKKLNDPYWFTIFNPVVDQKTSLKRYYIRGENIIRFIDMAKNGQLNNGTAETNPQ